MEFFVPARRRGHAVSIRNSFDGGLPIRDTADCQSALQQERNGRFLKAMRLHTGWVAQKAATCCRFVAVLLPIKLLIINNVADVADF
jgi:hypothetical protein